MPARFSHCVPFLPVKDLQETIAFYRDRLGFGNEWFWKDSDAGIKRDDFGLLFTRAPEHVAMINNDQRALEICVFVRDVDAVHAELQGKGIVITSPLRDEPWGMREFTVLDPNGYRLRIGEGLELVEERRKTQA